MKVVFTQKSKTFRTTFAVAQLQIRESSMSKKEGTRFLEGGDMYD